MSMVAWCCSLLVVFAVGVFDVRLVCVARFSNCLCCVGGGVVVLCCCVWLLLGLTHGDSSLTHWLPDDGPSPGSHTLCGLRERRVGIDNWTLTSAHGVG